jgi:hypothetical protein
MSEAHARAVRPLRIVAAGTGVLAAAAFFVGVAFVYRFHVRLDCDLLLGKWSIAAPWFRAAVVLSVVFWVCLILGSSGHTREVALFGFGLAIGLGIVFGATSAMEEDFLRDWYLMGRPEPSIPTEALVPDPHWCVRDFPS